MKGRSSSKPVIPTEGIEAETISGTYIRSLVKHLTSSTRSSGTKEHAQNVSKDGQSSSNANQTHPPPQPPRKKVRRRLHTSRPYQENLLNMAEARREIVAALKCHRASMKQQEAEKQQKQAVQQVSIPHESFGLDEKIVFSRRNPRIYSPRTDTQSDQNCLESLSYSSLSHLPPSPSYNSSCPFSFGGNSSIDIFPDILDVTLPSQTLGLNLNLQEFDILDSTYLYQQNSNNQSSLAYSSSSYSPPTTEEVIPSGEGTSSPGIDFGGGGFLHSVTNNEVMEEMRSIGEQHQMEWDNNMNLVTSAWWFKFSKSMEVDTQEIKAEDTNDVCQYHPLDQMMEFPSWINANEACLLQPLNGYCSVDKFQESSLPCMDLGEFEATDVEWLS